MVWTMALFSRACDQSDPNGSGCTKPVSQVLLNAVPAAVVGVVLLVSAVVFFVIARRRRRQFIANEAKERESLEIDLYESDNRHHTPAYADPFNDPNLSREPDYNEFSLAPPYPGRDPSPAKSSNAAESLHAPPSEASAPPAYHEEDSDTKPKETTRNIV